MTDLHDRFLGWLSEGAPGDPPRDLALHASGCSECLSRAAALDALGMVDIGNAADPPVLAAAPTRAGRLAAVARAGAGVAAIGLLGGAVLVGMGMLLDDPAPAAIGSGHPATQSPAEGVLGTADSPDEAASVTPDATASSTASPTLDPEETPDAAASSQVAATAAALAPAPTTRVALPAGTPRPTPVPTPRPRTPVPTAEPTQRPPTPAPSATPTPVPTATPEPSTPDATPTPVPEPSTPPPTQPAP